MSRRYTRRDVKTGTSFVITAGYGPFALYRAEVVSRDSEIVTVVKTRVPERVMGGYNYAGQRETFTLAEVSELIAAGVLIPGAEIDGAGQWYTDRSEVAA